MKPLRPWLCAGALLLPPLPALAAVEPGWFGSFAVGHTFYDADCGFDLACNSGGATAGKLGVGYQFGVFGLEGWLVDYGRSALPLGDHLRLNSVNLEAAWRWRWGSSVQGVLRAGVASVRQSRSVEDFRSTEPTVGVGLSLDVTPSLMLELAWDIVTSTGGSDRIGTVVAQPVTLGLRVRF